MPAIKLFSWNVNGIRAAYKKNALAWFYKDRPDVLCLQETKARKEQLPQELTETEGYYTYFIAAEKKGYSGVALYSSIEPENIKSGIGNKKFDTEGRILIADYKKFMLFNIYFPNGKQSGERLKYKLDFYEAFLKYVDKLKDLGKNIIICGDVNTAHKEIDLARPKENEKISGFLPEERAWIDKFLSHGYIDAFRIFDDKPEQYTWWDLKTRARERNIGWRIDYFYISESLKKKVKSASIMPDIMGSDHCPIGIELSI